MAEVAQIILTVSVLTPTSILLLQILMQHSCAAFVAVVQVPLQSMFVITVQLENLQQPVANAQIVL